MLRDRYKQIAHPAVIELKYDVKCTELKQIIFKPYFSSFVFGIALDFMILKIWQCFSSRTKAFFDTLNSISESEAVETLLIVHQAPTL